MFIKFILSKYSKPAAKNLYNSTKTKIIAYTKNP